MVEYFNNKHRFSTVNDNAFKYVKDNPLIIPEFERYKGMGFYEILAKVKDIPDRFFLFPAGGSDARTCIVIKCNVNRLSLNDAMTLQEVKALVEKDDCLEEKWFEDTPESAEIINELETINVRRMEEEIIIHEIKRRIRHDLSRDMFLENMTEKELLHCVKEAILYNLTGKEFSFHSDREELVYEMEKSIIYRLNNQELFVSSSSSSDKHTESSDDEFISNKLHYSEISEDNTLISESSEDTNSNNESSEDTNLNNESNEDTNSNNGSSEDINSNNGSSEDVTLGDESGECNESSEDTESSNELDNDVNILKQQIKILKCHLDLQKQKVKLYKREIELYKNK